MGIIVGTRKKLTKSKIHAQTPFVTSEIIKFENKMTKNNQATAKHRQIIEYDIICFWKDFKMTTQKNIWMDKGQYNL